MKKSKTAKEKKGKLLAEAHSRNTIAFMPLVFCLIVMVVILKDNYSRFFSGREVGEKPFTLIDFFQDNYITILDESHVTLPQIRAMYNGDRARKSSLVEQGFRVPSALDNSCVL